MQLWHGIIEYMNLLTDITYDIVIISTSEFTTRNNFKKTFLAKEFLELGYPRNDAFLKDTHDEFDLIFVDKSCAKFKTPKQTRKNSCLYAYFFRQSDFVSQNPSLI